MNAERILHDGHRAALAAVDGLTAAQWEEAGVCGVWSVRQIVAHLASVEHLLTDAFYHLHDPHRPTPTLDAFRAYPVDEFNGREVARRADLSAAATLAEYAGGHERNALLLAPVPLAERRRVGIFPWYGPAYDLDDFIVYVFYGHKQEHCAQIAVYRDRLRAAAP